MLSSQRTLCVTHVSGMNCHPSLRKGTSYRFPYDETKHTLVQFVGAALNRFKLAE